MRDDKGQRDYVVNRNNLRCTEQSMSWVVTLIIYTMSLRCYSSWKVHVLLPIVHVMRFHCFCFKPCGKLYRMSATPGGTTVLLTLVAVLLITSIRLDVFERVVRLLGG